MATAAPVEEAPRRRRGRPSNAEKEAAAHTPSQEPAAAGGDVLADDFFNSLSPVDTMPDFGAEAPEFDPAEEPITEADVKAAAGNGVPTAAIDSALDLGNLFNTAPTPPVATTTRRPAVEKPVVVTPDLGEIKAELAGHSVALKHLVERVDALQASINKLQEVPASVTSVLKAVQTLQGDFTAVLEAKDTTPVVALQPAPGAAPAASKPPAAPTAPKQPAQAFTKAEHDTFVECVAKLPVGKPFPLEGLMQALKTKAFPNTAEPVLQELIKYFVNKKVLEAQKQGTTVFIQRAA